MPRHHVGIDDLRFSYKPKGHTFIHQFLPALDLEQRNRLAATRWPKRELRRVELQLEDDDGNRHDVVIDRSTSDLMPDGKRKSPYRTCWDVRLKRGLVLLAQVRHAGFGHAAGRVWIDIKGMGCRLGFVRALCQSFVQSPVRGSVRFHRVDVAVDLEVPVEALIVFQRPTPDLPSRRHFRRFRAYRARSALYRPSGLQLGNVVSVYDGFEKHDHDTEHEWNGSFRPVPPFVADWTHWTRFELKLTGLGKLRQVFDRAHQLFESLDVRFLAEHTPAERTDLLVEAIRHGFRLSSPLLIRSVAPWIPPDAAAAIVPGRCGSEDRHGKHRRRHSLDVVQFAFERLLEAGLEEHKGRSIAEMLRDLLAARLGGFPQVDMPALFGPRAQSLIAMIKDATSRAASPYGPWQTARIVTDDRVSLATESRYAA